MPYWECYYHLVWATKDRLPLLSGEVSTIAERAIRSVCRDQGAVVHAFGIMPDHVHIAVSIPPRISVSDLVRLVKGSSSHLINHYDGRNKEVQFSWQPEYGVLTFGKRSLSQIVAYVSNQQQHHTAGTPLPLYERFERQVLDSG